MMRVATTLLSPEEMGRVSLVLTTVAFFALFLVNPVGMFINRRLHAWQAGGVARHYLIRYVNYLIMVAIFAAINIPLLYLTGIANFGISVGWLLFLVCGTLFFNTINQTAIPSLNLLGDSGRFVLLSVATIAASFVIATLLVRTLQPLAQYWLSGLLLGQTLIGIIGVHIFFRRLEKNGPVQASPVIRRRHMQALFSFAWPVAIAAGLGWVQGQGYRYLMEAHLGLAQLGLFVAGYGISAGVIAGFESVVTAYFQPRLYRDANMGGGAKQALAWQRYAVAVIPAVLLTVALIVTLAPELTRIFLGEKFQSATEYVVWGALAEAARVLTSVYTLRAHVDMRTRTLILPGVIGASMSIVLSLVLIPRLGAIGIGAALALSGFAVVVVMHSIMVGKTWGVFSERPVLRAALYAGGIWAVVEIARGQFSTEWSGLAGTLTISGLLYLGCQYSLLREYLKDRES